MTEQLDPIASNIISMEGYARNRVVSGIEDNPDDAARAVELSKASGVPAPAVLADLDEFTKAHKRKLASDIIRNNHHLADFVSADPINSRIANDDYGQLDVVSEKLNVLKNPSAIDRGFVSGLIKSNPENLSKTLEALSNIVHPDFAPEVRSGAKQLSDIAKLLPSDYARQTGSMWESLTSVDRAFTWAGEALGEGLASTVPGIGTGLGGMYVGSRLGGKPGAMVGGAVGAGLWSYASSIGEVYGALIEHKVDPLMASEASLIAAIPMAALDAASAAPIIARLGGVQKVKEAFARNIALRIAQEGLKGVGRESITEIFQDMIKDATVSVMSGEPFWTEKNIKSWLEAGVVGGMTGGVTGGGSGVKADKPHPVQDLFAAIKAADPYLKQGKDPPIGLHPALDDIKVEQSEMDLKALDEALKESEKSATRERNPEIFASFLRGHGDAKIGVSAEAVQALYGDKPPTADDNVLGWVPRIAEQLEQSAATGIDIQVPLADWLAKVDPEVAKQLHDDVRVRPGGITKNEAKELGEIKAQVDADLAIIEEGPVRDVRRAAGLEPMFRGEPLARKLELKKLDRTGKVEGPFHDFAIQDQTGKEVGYVVISEQEAGKTLYIDYMFGDKGQANTFGTSAVRDILRQLKEQFPQAENIAGFRVSGAREKAASWMDKGSVKIALGEVTDENIQQLLDYLNSRRKGEWVDYYDDGTIKGLIRPNEAYTKKEREIAKIVNDELKRLIPKAEDVQAIHGIRAKGVERDFSGMYVEFNNRGPLVLWSFTSDDPVGTGRHEAIHFLRNQGFFDEAEWATLVKAVKDNGWIEKHRIREKYPHVSEAVAIEEAIADEFSQWRRDTRPKVVLDIDRLFDRLAQLLDGLKAKFRELLGKDPTFTDLFDKVDAGEIGKREGREPLGRLGMTDLRGQVKEPELPGMTRMEDREAFEKANAIGMTVQAYERYIKLIDKRQQEDFEAAKRKAEADERKRQSPEWKANAARMREEVVKDINNRPDVAADSFFRDGNMYGQQLESKPRLNSELLTEDQIAGLPASYTSKSGMHPDDAASLFGYPTGKLMLDNLIAFHKQRGNQRPDDFKRKLITQEVERRMEQQYGVLQENILEQAIEQAVSDTQLDILHEEVLALGIRGNMEFSITKEQLREQIQIAFHEMIASDVSSDKFLAASGKAWRLIELNLLKDKVSEAFRIKQQQYISVIMAKEAIKLEKAEKALLKKTKSFEGQSKKNVDQAHTNFIHVLMKQAGLPLKIDEVELQSALDHAGFESLDSFILNEASYGGIDLGIELGYSAKPIEQITVSEFYDFKGAIDALDKAGREAQMITVGNRRLRREEWEAEAAALLKERPKRARGPHGEAKSNLFYGLEASITRIEELAKSFDFREELGPFFDALIVPFEQSKTKAFDMLTELTKNIKEMKNTKWRKTLGNEVQNSFVYDPSSETLFKLTRWNVVKMMLNVGTESNFDALAKGIASAPLEGKVANKEQIAEARMQIEELINKNATQDDWAFVEKIWSLWKPWRKEADTMYRNMSDRVPKWIPDRVFQTPFGEKQGGYVPLFPDDSRMIGRGIRTSEGPSMSGPLGKDYARATIPTPFYRNRTGAAYFVDISNGPENLVGRMQQMIHDIAYRDFVVNASKVIYSPRIKNLIKEHYGAEYEAQLDPWLRRIANEHTVDEKELQGWNDVLARFKLNLMVYALPLNYAVELSPAVGALNIKQMVLFNSDRKANAKIVEEHSKELKHLLYNFDRDINEQMSKIMGVGRYTAFQMQAMQALLKPLYLAEHEFRSVTFWAEYMHQKAQGRTDFEAASMGDSLIRERHGASAIGDLPALMASKNQFVRVATIFMGYFTTMRNLMRQGPDQIRQGEYKDFAKTMWMTLGVAALFNAALFTKRKEDDTIWSFGARAILDTPLSMIPYAREGWQYYSQGIQPRSPIFGMIKAVGDLGKDGWDWLHGKQVKHPIKHIAAVAGTLGGVPGGLQIGRTGEFAHDIATNQQRPRDIIEWIRGAFTSESRLRK